ncbi:hatching enzyme 1.2-like [Oculina patagonica]
MKENKGVEGLYQGDILLNQQQEEALKSTKARAAGYRLWPGGVVPYALSSEFEGKDAYVFLFNKALAEWEHQTCIKFKQRTTETAYILFTYGKGCYSYVGYQGNKQTLSLGLDCWATGTLLHEIGHALGFFHEQARPDRDMYINIDWQNIQEGKASNFDKMSLEQQQSWMPFGTPYDYFSIMHFSSYAFTKNYKPTITPKNEKIRHHYIGQRDAISYLDLQQINLMYKCPGNAARYYDTICENHSKQVTCYGGRKIKITYANYGRKSFSKCGFGGFNTNCESATSFEKVSKACNGRSSCLLQATDEEFGDPCRYTRKYLDFKYECHP